jgi:hypothetical protein
VIFWLFILAAVFWMGFEQAGSSLNLFARDLTDRNIFGVGDAGVVAAEREPVLHHRARAGVREPVGVAREAEREPEHPGEGRRSGCSASPSGSSCSRGARRTRRRTTR